MPSSPPAVGGSRQPRIAIVGAGLSGIVCGAMLQKNNLNNFVIFEKFEEFGGTWYQNYYPNLSCDVPAFAYQVSFEQNPSWTRPYPPRDELLQYCIDVAEKYNLRPKTRFNQDVTAFKWNDDRNTWTLSIAESDGLENLGAALPDEEFDLVFNYRKGAFFGYVPDVPGARDDTFKGLAWHSMDWKVGGMGLLKGKNVAVVGLAAAGIQIIPCIAPHCGSLTIYPRTPNHIHPKPNDPFSEEQKAEWAKDPVAYRMWCAKMSTEYFAKWEGAMLHPGSDIANAEEKACADMLEAQVKDPKLREVFRPNYKPWARRMLFSNEFYPTLSLPNVEVANEKLVRIEADGIVSKTQSPRLGMNSGVGKEIAVADDPNAVEKKRKIDVIIWATGFDFFHGGPTITGRNGVTAMDIMMRDGEPKMYQGGFQEAMPNFINGCAPMFNQAPTSFITNIEICMDQALLVIKKMINENLASFEVTREAVDKWDKLMCKESESTAYGLECEHSYYKMYRPDGTFKTPTFYPGTANEMKSIFAKLNEDDWSFVPAKEAGQKWGYGDGAAIAKELKEAAAKVKFGGVYSGKGSDSRVL